MARKLPEYNASSLADIAFMLLIFFLVTTTMDTDLGISRMLPPPVPPNQNNDENTKIKERNVFVVLINKDNKLLVEGRPMDISNLKNAAKEFIANPNNSEQLPEFKPTQVQYFGLVDVSKQIISLQNDRGTSYGLYIRVQNELAMAYNELREGLALTKFGKVYNDLSDEQMKSIRKIYPQRISEAEPKNYGGGN